MHASVRTLLTGIVDYAGLFPPAQLDLAPAVQNYAKFRTGSEAWMLGRFVCPTSRFAALLEFRDTIRNPDSPFRISAIGRSGESAEALIAGISADLDDMNRLRDGSGGGAVIDAYEVKLPAAVVKSRDGIALRKLLDQIGERFDSAGFDRCQRFYEASLLDPWREHIRTVIAGIARHNHKIMPHLDAELRVDRTPPKLPDGLKLRTGGVTADAFPSTEQVAYIIQQCRDAHVPMKFTAGLHHPLRRFDPGVRTMMHGFLNIFAAVTLAHAALLDFHDILAVVEELDAKNFEFSDEFVCWNDASATIDEIQYARAERGLSFGSCSFDEPCDDLRAMRLL
ncbi:MAG: hypothetical protein IT450_02180 [Phycisphaerales bacterium]|nr:hypothetical protein [Phycisphaerales bacterium]